MGAWTWLFLGMALVALVLGLYALVQGDWAIAASLILLLAVGLKGVVAERALARAGR